MDKKQDAIVLFSGGQDSTTCLVWAKQNFNKVHAISFFYNQRHAIELHAAQKIIDIVGVESYEIVEINNKLLKGRSPLINKTTEILKFNNVSDIPNEVASTFVPGRNLLFLTIAANRAYNLGIYYIIGGMNQIDYSLYPDCRSSFINAAERVLSNAFFGEGIPGEIKKFHIHTPLLNLSKKEIVLLAKELNCLDLMKYTMTCYFGSVPPCMQCSACLLREKGFKEAGIQDPLLESIVQ